LYCIDRPRNPDGSGRVFGVAAALAGGTVVAAVVVGETAAVVVVGGTVVAAGVAGGTVVALVRVAPVSSDVACRLLADPQPASVSPSATATAAGASSLSGAFG
jgi:hypothetical protein